MASYKTTGIIIRRSNYAEADRIYSILTLDRGIVEAIAKGVRKPLAKLNAHLELFCVIELMLAEGRSLDIITSARALTNFTAIAGDYERLKRGFLICEVVNKLAKQTATAATYDLTLEALEALNGSFDPHLIELYFKLKFVDQLGYRPNLEQSLKSRDEIIASRQYFFSSAGGGLVDKASAELDNPPISSEHIKLWRLILEHSLAQLAKVKGTGKPAQESLPIANDFYDYLFGKRFKSSEI